MASVTFDEATRLYHAVRDVMRAAVDAGGSSLGNGLGNYRQHDGQPGAYQPRLTRICCQRW